MAMREDLHMIYQREKEKYGIKMMIEQNTLRPEYEFETFEEWMKNAGYE